MSPHAEHISGSTVMVTGGCGFIGSHLVRELLARGAQRIVVVDSLRYGDQANLGRLSNAVEVIKYTLGSDDVAVLDATLRGVHYLFHLAAEKHNQSKDNPLEVFRSNINGTYTLFDLAARRGVKKIIFTSSLYAYGRMSGAPFVETELPQPKTVYGISKLCGEHLLAHMHAQHGIAYNVLRYLFVYGPRQFAGMGYKSVIVKNFERIRAGQPPTIYGDGEQTLDYVYVDDAVDATIAALETDVQSEVFNVGTGIATSVNQLIDAMLRVSQQPLRKQHEAADWTAGSYRVGDVSKIRSRLGWSARTSLEEGLSRTFQWMAESARDVTSA